jgi:antitoxin StbD
MPNIILSNITASITELKKHPMATVNSAKGEALAILSRNKPVFYCVPPKMYEAMLDALNDIEVSDITKAIKEEIEVTKKDL